MFDSGDYIIESNKIVLYFLNNKSNRQNRKISTIQLNN